MVVPTPTTAEIGKHRAQNRTTFLNVEKLTPSCVDFANPTKSTAPTVQWVDETGIPEKFLVLEKNHDFK